jgi:hypothetical protein
VIPRRKMDTWPQRERADRWEGISTVEPHATQLDAADARQLLAEDGV